MLFTSPHPPQHAAASRAASRERKAAIDRLIEYNPLMTWWQFVWAVVRGAATDACSVASFLLLLAAAFWPTVVALAGRLGWNVTWNLPEDQALRWLLGIFFVGSLVRVAYKLRQEVALELVDAQALLADRTRRQERKSKLSEFMQQGRAFLNDVASLTAADAHDRATRWIDELQAFVREDIGEGEANQLLNHAGLIGFSGGSNSRERNFVTHCLTRLGELVARVDTLDL
jgi:hypothetical protein